MMTINKDVLIGVSEEVKSELNEFIQAFINHDSARFTKFSTEDGNINYIDYDLQSNLFIKKTLFAKDGEGNDLSRGVLIFNNIEDFINDVILEMQLFIKAENEYTELMTDLKAFQNTLTFE